MERFLGTVITIILIFYIIKYLIRLLAPFLITHMAKKMAKKFNDGQAFNGQGFNGFYTNFGEDAQQEQKSEEGDITIQRQQKAKKGQSLSEELGGEYVDYEEVK